MNIKLFQDNLPISFQDPLETFEEKMDTTELPMQVKNNEFMEIKEQTTMPDSDKIDAESHTFSDDYVCFHCI